ncbi:MAG: UxaA family hydrolase [Acidobacteriota bacterium]
MIKVIKIHERDNVAVALQDMLKGEMISVDGTDLEIKGDIRKGHKVALKNLNENENVIKYGFVIGRTQMSIHAGSHIHSHNIKTTLSEESHYSYKPAGNIKNSPFHGAKRIFKGYKRINGTAGTRNEIWIINTVGCVNTSAERLAKLANEKFNRQNFDGVFSFSHPYGCSQLGGDHLNTQKALRGLILNPNAGGVLVLGLGCENNQLKDLIASLGDLDKSRLRSFNSQDVEDEIGEGLRLIEELFEVMKEDSRTELPLSDLTLGMKCGGSDGLSGITANPLVGRITDKITDQGGSVILSEVPEMFGAEQLLMDRSIDRATFDKMVLMINSFKEYFLSHNQPVYENPSPGNKEGGITTLEEKSLGAIQKGGDSIVREVLDYGMQKGKKGLMLLKAPGNDGVSSTAMVASGASLILFTTGRGTPLGFPVPTIKISTNSELFLKKKSWIDFNAGELLGGNLSWEEMTEKLLDFVIKVASGEIKTKNEINGYREIAVWKDGVTL